MDLNWFGLIGAAFFGMLGGPVGLELLKYVKERKKNNASDPLVDAVQEGVIISDEMDRLLQEYGADRVWIAQFHNGGLYYPTGKSIQKFSISYEVTKSAKDSMKMTFQNIPVSLFNNFLSMVLEDDIVAIPDYKDEKIATHGMKYVAEEYGTRSTYTFSLRTIHDKLIGVLCIDYTARKKTLAQEDLRAIQLESIKIGSILEKKK